MAELMTNNESGGKSNRATKRVLRVDFTPMVDMNMLLITFFMFCTTLSIPQVMDIVTPADTVTTIDKPTEIPESRTITVLLGKDNKVFYYYGKANYQNFASLHETTYAPSGGLRDVIVDKNKVVVERVTQLKRDKKAKNMSNESFKEQMKTIKSAKDGAIVIIKATPDATYANLVNALDEMAICSVGVYTIDKLADGDKFLLENYEAKGALTAQAAKP